MSKWTPKDLPHSPPEAVCKNCGDWFWECDLVNGLCQPCSENQEEEYQACENCYLRMGSKCRKLKEYIGMSDWCHNWKKEEVK